MYTVHVINGYGAVECSRVSCKNFITGALYRETKGKAGPQPSPPGPKFLSPFQVRGQISLSISSHCLRVTPQATLTQAGTSKPRDTRRRLATQRTPTPSHFPTVTLRGNGSPWLQGPLHAAWKVRRVDLTSLERVEVRKRFLDVTTGQTLFDSRAETPRALSPGRRLT